MRSVPGSQAAQTLPRCAHGQLSWQPGSKRGPIRFRSTPRTQERRAVTVHVVSASSASTTSSSSYPAVDRNKKQSGRSTYKPASFRELIQDAADSIILALEDGEKRMEVEFPVLPGADVRYKGSSDAFIDASVQLALAGARVVSEKRGLRVHIVVPDEAEYRRSSKMFQSSLGLSPMVSLGYLSEGRTSFMTSFAKLLTGDEGPSVSEIKEAACQADIFFAVNASTVELGAIEQYCRDTVGERALVLWCLELDTLRADLGLLGFPPKALQHRFLCNFKPVFYIRQRDYSKSVAVAPFIINYSGILFREYPGPFQCMLRQDDGMYACVAEQPRRYNLGEFKEELMEAMGLIEGEDDTSAFLRRGYKTSTWWEDDTSEETSSKWRD